MWPEFLQFLAFFLIAVELHKITAAAIVNQNPGSAFGNALAWFDPV